MATPIITLPTSSIAILSVSVDEFDRVANAKPAVFAPESVCTALTAAPTPWPEATAPPAVLRTRKPTPAKSPTACEPEVGPTSRPYSFEPEAMSPDVAVNSSTTEPARMVNLASLVGAQSPPWITPVPATLRMCPVSGSIDAQPTQRLLVPLFCNE